MCEREREHVGRESSRAKKRLSNALDFFSLFDPFSVCSSPPPHLIPLSTSKKNSDDDDASDITIPLPAVRKRELVSIFGFCARQLEGRDELERIRQREEAREGGQGRRAAWASGGRGSRGGGGGGAEAASASPAPGAGPSHAALSLALRAALAADAAAWASSRSSSSSSSSSAGGIGVGGSGGGGGHSSRALLGRALAANFLDIPVALAACADAVAAGIRGRSPAEIRARFGIAPDLSVAEEEAIKADCAWAFDCC